MHSLQQAFAAVLDASWRGGFVVALGLAGRWALKGKVAARVWSIFWVLLAARLLIPGVVSASWSPFGAARIVGPAVGPQTAGLGGSAAGRLIGSALGVARSSANPDRSRDRFARGFSPRSFDWLAGIWAAGVVALILARLGAWMRFQLRVERGGAAAPGWAVLVVHAVARELGARAMPVMVTGAVLAPALQGIFRPRLLFPVGLLEELDESELRFVIAHELAHDRRRDLLAAALLHAAAVIHWFNPFAWLLARAARRDCEFACDEWVVRRLNPGDPRRYGAALLRIASLVQIGPPPPLALGMAESKQQLTRRIKMILSKSSAKPLPALAAFAALLLLTAFTFTARSRAAEAAAPFIVEADHFATLFPNGVVATVGDRTITTEQVRREVAAQIPDLESTARSQKSFDVKLEQLRNEVVQHLVNRALLLGEFRASGKHIAPKFVDQAVANDITNRYGGEQAKFEAYLKLHGQTPEQYRTAVEENIIFSYMTHQQHVADGDSRG